MAEWVSKTDHNDEPPACGEQGKICHHGSWVCSSVEADSIPRHREWEVHHQCMTEKQKAKGSWLEQRGGDATCSRATRASPMLAAAPLRSLPFARHSDVSSRLNGAKQVCLLVAAALEPSDFLVPSLDGS